MLPLQLQLLLLLHFKFLFINHTHHLSLWLFVAHHFPNTFHSWLRNISKTMFTRDALQQAATAAMEPGDSARKTEGLALIAQIESEAQLWLVPSLEILQNPSSPTEAQFVAFQVVDRTLASSPTSEQLNIIRETIWSRSMNLNVVFITNKLADCLTTLFITMYPASWSTFFENLLQLINDRPESMELVASLLLAIHRKIGDQLFERTPAEHAKANDLKDAIRVHDMNNITQIFSVLLQSSPKIIIKALDAFSGFSQWADIQLMLPLFPLLKQNLEKSIPDDDLGLSATAERAICALLAKKMDPEAKLELLKTTGVLDSSFMAYPLIAHSVLLESSKGMVRSNVQKQLVLVSDAALNPVLNFLKSTTDEETELSIQLIPGLTEYIKGTSNLDTVAQVLKALIMTSKRSDFRADDTFDELRQQLVSLQLLIAQNTNFGELFYSVASLAIGELLAANDPFALELAVHELSVMGLLCPTHGSEFSALVLKVTDTPVCDHPILAVPFVDLCARHAVLLESNGNIISILNCVSQALKISDSEVQVRAFRSLHRLVKSALNKNSIDSSMGEQLLTLLEPLFGMDTDPQLYELCGFLIGVSNSGESELQKLLNALCSTPDLPHLSVLVSLIKGVVECNKLPDPLKAQLLIAAQYVIVVLEQHPELRDPCRQIFSHILACLGSNALYAETTAFVELIVRATDIESLSGLLSFVTQLMHAFRGDSQILTLLSNLAPALFSKVFEILGTLDTLAKEQQGSTDTELERRNAVSCFVQFIPHVVGNGFGLILNPELLSHVLSALASVVSTDPNRQNQRLAVVSLTRLVSLDQISQSDEAMQNLTGLCYAVPSNLGAVGDMKPVVLELAALQHALIQRGGPGYIAWLTPFLEGSGIALNCELPLKEFKQMFIQQQERLNING